MKKYLWLPVSLITLVWAKSALAAPSIEEVIGTIEPPPPTKDLTLTTFLSNVVTIIFIVGGLLVFFMIIFAAFQWITSGGEKEAISKARGRITWAIIGMVVLALSFVIVRVLGEILGFELVKIIP